MAAIAELEASLQALLTLKPPGVTKGRIQSITQLCVENVKSESLIIQKIFTHFKRTPGTHKLGVLYAVDSVVRQWIERSGPPGQRADESTDGTYVAGVNRVSELMPTMMSDLIAQSPLDQLDKINKLVDIWERGNTFPSAMLADFKSRIISRPTKQPTPEPEKPAQSTLPTQPSTNASFAQAPAQLPPLPQLNGQTQPAQQSQEQVPQSIAPPAPPTAPPAALAPAAVPGVPQEGLSALATVLPPHALADPQKVTHYLQVLQQLVQLGVPSEQWGDVIKALDQQQQGSGAQPGAQQAAGPAPPSHPSQNSLQQTRPSPPRGRSRSPTRRGSPTYDSYRERTPPRTFTPPGVTGGGPDPNRPKWIEFDPTLPPNNIKVLSRTLFVGGTTCPEHELREVFGRFGSVQSVICQPQKRHAFVKMYTREESVRAKTEMDRTDNQEMLARARSTKWGVGFGPRECCNYDQGVSVIPIDRLTDADRRWILSAEFGGNGGKEITYGQVIEEPDIEIGAGVSSKAISLKVGQQQSQPRNKQQNQGRRNNNRGGQDHRDRDRQPPQLHQQRGPPFLGYNPSPNPFPPYQPEQPMMPPPMQEHPMAMGFPPPMPFNFPPQGGFNGFPPPGMPPFPMQ